MSALLSRRAKAELDEIWSYIATESGSLEIADSAIEAITDTFLQLSKHPHLGRQRDDIRLGLRSLPVGSYVIVYRLQGDNVRILHVVHGRRNLGAVIRQ